MKKEWLHSLDAAITICDKKGTIVYMNRRSVESFKKEGGKSLIGSSLLDCHPKEASDKIKDMLISGKENIYSIEKNGVRKLIVQKPVYEHGNLAGLMEMSIVLPFDMPHFIRT